MQATPLNFCSFFTNYINHTQSRDLSVRDRKIALVTSVILGVLFAGIPHLISLLGNRCKKIDLHETPLSTLPRLVIPPIVNKYYLEIIHHITPEEREKIEKLLEAISKEEVEKFVSTNYPWNGFKELPLYALKAVKLGLFSNEQFATVCLFTAAIPRHSEALLRFNKLAKISPVQVSLFNSDGSKNNDAELIIKETLCPYPKMDSWLTQDQLDAFFNKMSKLPPLEQQFLVIGDCDQFGGKSICSNIYDERCNVFGCFVKHTKIPFITDIAKENADKLRLIPSGGMIQSLLEVLGPIKAHFVLGETNLEENVGKKHNITVPFNPWVVIPDNIQGLKACDIDYTYCEFYYSLCRSLIPLEHQKLVDELTNLPLTKAIKTFKRSIRSFYLPTLHENLFDVLKVPKSTDMGFWGAIEYGIRHIDAKDPNYLPCLKELAEYLAKNESGKPFGVTANGLIDLSEQMDNHRNDLLLVSPKHQGPKYYTGLNVINTSPIWKLLEIYQSMK